MAGFFVPGIARRGPYIVKTYRGPPADCARANQAPGPCRWARDPWPVYRTPWPPIRGPWPPGARAVARAAPARPPGRPGGPVIRGRCIARRGPWAVARGHLVRGPWPVVRVPGGVLPGARPGAPGPWAVAPDPGHLVADPWPPARAPWWPPAVARAPWCAVPGARPPVPGPGPLAHGARPPGGVAGPKKRAGSWLAKALARFYAISAARNSFPVPRKQAPLCKKLDFGLQFFVEQIQFVP